MVPPVRVVDVCDLGRPNCAALVRHMHKLDTDALSSCVWRTEEPAEGQTGSVYARHARAGGAAPLRAPASVTPGRVPP
jgi:hypothetical protein